MKLLFYFPGWEDSTLCMCVCGSPSAPAVPATGETRMHKWSKCQQLHWRPQAIDSPVSIVPATEDTGWKAHVLCGMYVSMKLLVNTRVNQPASRLRGLGSQVSKQPQSELHTGKTRGSECWLLEGPTRPSKLLERPRGLGSAERPTHIRICAWHHWRLEDPRASYWIDRMSKAIRSVRVCACVCKGVWVPAAGGGLGLAYLGASSWGDLGRPGSQVLATE